MTVEIHWLGHDAFRLEGEKTVYIDPWKLPEGLPPAHLILITHDHYDHCSPEDVEKVRTAETVVAAPAAAAAKLKAPVTIVQPGDQLDLNGVPVEVVPAYNIDKPFHPKQAGHVGYIVTLGGERIYHTGDSDPIPEMNDLKVDIALLPVSGKYVMDADQAAELAGRLRPKLAIPMHYGEIVGSEADARRFQERCPVPVRILQPER
ncbi:MAG TPA: MBL fold metallo-hydrolase [Caldilineae bacterium]|nr:MBL fold metallo-hydrolase [Caldilineae bacterium]